MVFEHFAVFCSGSLSDQQITRDMARNGWGVTCDFFLSVLGGETIVKRAFRPERLKNKSLRTLKKKVACGENGLPLQNA